MLVAESSLTLADQSESLLEFLKAAKYFNVHRYCRKMVYSNQTHPNLLDLFHRNRKRLKKQRPNQINAEFKGDQSDFLPAS